MNERTLADLLATRREELGRSKRDQAARMGATVNTYRKWESTGRMAITTAFELAEDLGLSWELHYPVDPDLETTVLGLFAGDFSTEDDYRQALTWALRAAHYAAAMTRADASFDINALEGFL